MDQMGKKMAKKQNLCVHPAFIHLWDLIFQVERKEVNLIMFEAPACGSVFIIRFPMRTGGDGRRE